MRSSLLACMLVAAFCNLVVATDSTDTQRGHVMHFDLKRHRLPPHLEENRLRHKLLRNATDPDERRRITREMAFDENLIGYPTTAYSLPMAIGTPPQRVDCLVDTGSSNLAVAGSADAGVPRFFRAEQSSTYEGEDETFSVAYQDSSYFIARRSKDIIGPLTDDPDSARTDVEFGDIEEAKGFFGDNSLYQGILGMAYPTIAEPDDDPIKPFFDTFWRQTGIEGVFTLQLCDIQEAKGEAGYGRMSIGGFEVEHMVGSLFYTPIVEQTYFCVNVTGMGLDDVDLGVNCSDYNSPVYSIVDSGTTDLYIPRSAFEALKKQLPLTEDMIGGSKSDFYAGRTCSFMSDDLVRSLPNITVRVQASFDPGYDIVLYIRPWHYLRKEYDPESGQSCRVFAVGALPSSARTPTILGIPLFASYVIIFDVENKQIGFSASDCSGFAGENHTEIDVLPLGLPQKQPASHSDCKPLPYHPPKDDMGIVIWALLGVAGVVVLSLAILVAVKLRNRCQSNATQYQRLPTQSSSQDNFVDPVSDSDIDSDASEDMLGVGSLQESI